MRRVYAAAGVVLLSLLFALVALEVYVRVSSRFDDLRALLAPEAAGHVEAGAWGVGGDRDLVLNTLIHPFLGWVGRPGQGALRDEDPIPVFEDRKPTAWAEAASRINQLGFASNIDDYRDVPEESFAVAFLGGSVVQQVVEITGDTFVEALEQRFPRLAGRVRVLNLASGGYRQPQQLFALSEMLLLGVPLDLVILLDGFNEITSGAIDAGVGHHPFLPSKVHYAMTVDITALDPTRVRTLQMAEVIRSQKQADAWLEGATQAWWRHSELARVVAASRVRAYRLRARRSEQRLQVKLLAGEGGGRLATLDDPCLRTEAGCYELIADIWARASRAIAALAASEGIAYLHALQPSQYVPGSKVLSEQEREFAWHVGPAQEHVERGYGVLQARGETLRADGIAFHDLTRIYVDHKETLYHDPCCHLNRSGLQILARELVARLDDDLADGFGGP